MVTRGSERRKPGVPIPWPARWDCQRAGIFQRLVCSDLSDGAFRLWVELAFFCTESGPMCFAVPERHAERLNRSPATIMSYLRELKRRDLIRIERDGRAMRVVFNTENDT